MDMGCSAAPIRRVPRLGECYVALERCDHWVIPPLPESENEGLIMEMEWRERLLGSLQSWNASNCPVDASRVCVAIKAADELSGEAVEAAYASVVEYLGGAQGSGRAVSRPPRTKQRMRRSIKRYEYARTQDLFKKEARAAGHGSYGCERVGYPQECGAGSVRGSVGD